MMSIAIPRDTATEAMIKSSKYSIMLLIFVRLQPSQKLYQTLLAAKEMNVVGLPQFYGIVSFYSLHTYLAL
ncbi:hypothetical protein DRH14_05565 [Candidatus Shapirobacteria bacterium]|nr:MAG: hypothetical protein DRH14_05565 [Candidatus Shapirobacteria bacterium]